MSVVRITDHGAVLCLDDGGFEPYDLGPDDPTKKTPAEILALKVDKAKLDKRAFLAHYENSGNIREACAQLKVKLHTIDQWLDADTDFKLAFARAQRLAGNVLESEMKRRAVDGCRRYKFDKGYPVMWRPPEGHPDYEQWVPPADHPHHKGEGVEVQKLAHYYELVYSDALLMAMAKAAMPEKYGDKVDHTGSVAVKMYGFNPEEIGTRSLKELHAGGECEAATTVVGQGDIVLRPSSLPSGINEDLVPLDGEILDAP